MVKVFDVKGSKSSYKPPTDGVAEVSITDTGDHGAEPGLPAKTWVKVTNDTSVVRDLHARRVPHAGHDLRDGRRVLRRLLQHRRRRGRPAGVDQRWHLGSRAELVGVLRGVADQRGQVRPRQLERRASDDDSATSCTPTSPPAERSEPTHVTSPGSGPGSFASVGVRTRSGRRGRAGGRCSRPSRSAGSSSSTMRAASSVNAATGGAVGRGRARPARPVSPPVDTAGSIGMRGDERHADLRGERVAATARRRSRGVNRRARRTRSCSRRRRRPSCRSGAPCRPRGSRPSAPRRAGVVTTSISAWGSRRASPICTSPVPGGMSTSR